MQRRRRVKEEQEAVTYQNTVAAKVIEQRLASVQQASDPRVSPGTGFRTPAQAVPALPWHCKPVQGRQPPSMPPIAPPGTHAGDGVDDAGDDDKLLLTPVLLASKLLLTPVLLANKVLALTLFQQSLNHPYAAVPRRLS